VLIALCVAGMINAFLLAGVLSLVLDVLLALPGGFAGVVLSRLPREAWPPAWVGIVVAVIATPALRVVYLVTTPADLHEPHRSWLRVPGCTSP
jgi:hypothetical protein